MAIQETRTLPAPFIESLGKDYATELKSLTQTRLPTESFQPKVAAQDTLQTQAASLAGSGLGGYAPYIDQAKQYSGPSGYSGFMSPYQQEVIDTTLTEYDKQAQIGQQGIMDQATRMNALGAGRTGVQLAEYQSGSDAKRALLNAQMLQGGFGQAQQGATLDAERESNRMAAYEPYERLGFLGSGITGIMGGYPGQYQWSATPNPTPLQTALGVGATAGGIYGNIKGRQPYQNYE